MWLVRLFPLLAIGQLLEAAQSSPTAASRKMDSNENLMLIYAFEGEPKSSEPNESKPIRRSIPPQAFAMGGMGGMNGIGGMGGMGGMGGISGMGGMGGMGGIGGMGGMGGMGGFGGLGGMGGIGGLSGAGGIGGIGGLSGVGGMGGIGGMTGGMGAFPGAFGGPSGYGGYGGMGYLGPSAMYGTGFRGYPGYNSMANTAGMTYPYWNTQLGTTWANPGFNNFVNSWNTLNSNPSMYNSGTWGLTNVIPSSSGFGNDLYNSGSWNRVNYNSGDPYNQYPGQNGIFGGQSGFSNGQSFYNRYNGQSAFGTSQTYGSGTSTSFSTDNNYKRSSPGPQSPYYVRLFPDPFNQDNEETSSSSLSKSRTTGRRSATVGDQPAPQAEPL